jgi:hypothetical protein
MITLPFQIGLAIGLAVAAAIAPQWGDAPKGKMAITKKPLTVRIDPTDELRAAVKAAPKASVQLSLDDLVPPARRELIRGVRVFLNKDDATSETATDDPHYVTAFVFSPTRGQEPEGYNLDLTAALARLHKAGELDLAKPLRITLVAVPAPGVKELPADFSIPVGRVSAEVVEPPQ